MKQNKTFSPQDITGILPPLLTPFDVNENSSSVCCETRSTT